MMAGVTVGPIFIATIFHEVVMPFPPLLAFNLKQWIEENRESWGPRRSPWEHSDFITMVHKGPTAGKQFHVNQGEEIFLQLEGELNCHYVRRQASARLLRSGRAKCFFCPVTCLILPGGSRAPGLWLSNANANRMRSMVGFGIAKTATINFMSQSRDMARDPGTR